jgi:sulfide:quinone oxidoreductase
MTEDGWIPVDRATLKTRFPGVYAVGDVTSVGTPKAGVFSEGAARVVAEQLIAQALQGEGPAGYDGVGACYIEFGGGEVGKVQVDFFSGPHPTGSYYGASDALAAEKHEFGASRRRRWFGLTE